MDKITRLRATPTMDLDPQGSSVASRSGEHKKNDWIVPVEEPEYSRPLLAIKSSGRVGLGSRRVLQQERRQENVGLILRVSPCVVNTRSRQGLAFWAFAARDPVESSRIDVERALTSVFQ